LVVYLDADDAVLLERIAGRGRPYEASITSSYLDSVRDAYERYLDSCAELKVLRINTTDLDLSSQADLNELYASILVRCD